MHRSKVMGAVLTLALFGGLALAPCGCSNDDPLASSPDVDLSGLGYDGYPPATPTGLGMLKATDAGFKLGWSASPEEDLAGYRVYVYEPSPYRDNSYVCAHGNCLIEAQKTYYLFTNDLSFGAHYFRISAVDHDGNESVRTAPLEFYYDGGPTEQDSFDDGCKGEPARGPQGIPGSGLNPKEDEDLEGSGHD